MVNDVPLGLVITAEDGIVFGNAPMVVSVVIGRSHLKALDVSGFAGFQHQVALIYITVGSLAPFGVEISVKCLRRTLCVRPIRPFDSGESDLAHDTDADRYQCHEKSN